MSGVSYKTVDENSHGQRLDNYLIKILKGVPKSKVYQIVRKGEVRVNKKRAKVSTRLENGDEVRIPPVRVAENNAESRVPHWISAILSDNIVFESDDYLVINKPAGIAVHGGSNIRTGLIEAIRLALPEQYFELVHRLDRATSGVLVLAKNRDSLLRANNALSSSKKHYDVLVYGNWPSNMAVIETNLQKANDGTGERKVFNGEDGKLARTRFTVKKKFSDYTLLEAALDSGRTHQIRAHCVHAGCPIVGDEKYAERDSLKLSKQAGCSRMFLHARYLSMPQVGVFEAPLPSELNLFISRI